MSYLGRTAGQTKLDNKTGWSLILFCLQLNAARLSSPISVRHFWRTPEDLYKYWILLEWENLLNKHSFSNNCLKFLQFISSLIEYLMVFPELRSTENYAMKNPAIASDLSQLSLCFFIKLVQDQGDQIVVSYARVHSNDMIVEIYPTRTEFYVGFKMFR